MYRVVDKSRECGIVVLRGRFSTKYYLNEQSTVYQDFVIYFSFTFKIFSCDPLKRCDESHKVKQLRFYIPVWNISMGMT